MGITLTAKDHKVVSREEWLKARKEFLLREKEFTRKHDELCEQRRALPWVKVEDYEFEGPQGKVYLSDLFQGRDQLYIYHFMLGPDSKHICSGCSLLVDHVDAARQHFEQADLSFAAVSRAQISRIEQVRQRMNWKFQWVSSFDSSFNYDFGVSFSPEQVDEGSAIYNFDKEMKESGEGHGSSVFLKDGENIYHTYSSYARGAESVVGAFSFLDFVPKGRNEPNSIMEWVKLHDEYGK